MTTHTDESNTAPSDSSTTSAEVPAVEPSPMLQDQNLPLVGIEEPSETDVLCGRGGAALRHPGNQTYRRLVHLNKGLYITCLKAEKLKISKSIVAAIREQNGRFLEKNVTRGTWYDIGDKKAMEKTSQALREGQPKLRQKIVELGGGAAGAAALLETQFPSAAVGGRAYTGGASGGDGASAAAYPSHGANASFQSQQAAAAAAVAAAAAATQNQYGQPPPNHHHHMAPGAGAPAGTYSAPASLHNLTSGVAIHSTNTMPSRCHLRDLSSQEYMQQRLSLNEDDLRRSNSMGNNNNNEFMSSDSSLLQNFSNFGMQDMNVEAIRLGMQQQPQESTIPRPFPSSQQQPQEEQQEDESEEEAGSEPSVKMLDRRGVFARMKYEGPASGRLSHKHLQQTSGRSLGDALSDVHFSDMSNMTAGSSMEPQPLQQHTKVPTVAEVFGGSRRSIMSGLSKISDADNSIISDLSRKIGNVSTRSLLSEISGMDEESVDVTIDTRDLALQQGTTVDSLED